MDQIMEYLSWVLKILHASGTPGTDGLTLIVSPDSQNSKRGLFSHKY